MINYNVNENNVCVEGIRDRIANSTVEQKDAIIMQLMKTEIKGFYINTTKYVKSIGIEPQVYNCYVKRIARTNPEFYEMYCIAKANNYASFSENAKDTLLHMNELLKSGILLTDGNTREFDVIDCHMFIKNNFQDLGRARINKILGELESENRGNQEFNSIGLRTILGRSYSDNCNTVGGYYNLTIEQIIDDNSYNLTLEEKQQMFNYFNFHKIPYNLSTYHAAAQRIKKCNVDKQNNYFTESYRIKSKKA